MERLGFFEHIHIEGQAEEGGRDVKDRIHGVGSIMSGEL